MKATPAPRNKARHLLNSPCRPVTFATTLSQEVEIFVTSHRARITWAPRGGSGSLPTALQYATIARFAEDDSWPNDAWSIVCAFDAPPVLQRNPAEARIRFLADAAPHHRLKPGAIFSLYEGRTDVATVEVLD
jgi:hypothetical protein